MCAYFSQDDVEAYTGFSSSDFKWGGSAMSTASWATFCSFLVDTTTQLVNKWCNVTSFESHSVTEYHDGRGDAGDDDTYLDEDVTFYLREYATAVASVYEDANAKTGTINWTLRTERSTATAGDYEVATRNELVTVTFHDNYPVKGRENVKIIYTGGYASGSTELNELKWICLRIVKNILLEKKKIAESTTIRQAAVRDFSEMFKPVQEGQIMTDDIRRDLHKYRRYRMGGPAWD